MASNLRIISDRSPGLELGYAGAERAADRAGKEWRILAFRAFYQFTKRGKPFTTEEVRKANPALPTPPETRAWGQVALSAARLGVVVRGGLTRAQSKGAHGRWVTQWVPALRK